MAADKLLQARLVDFVAFEEVDVATRVALEAGVEQLAGSGIFARVGKRYFDFAFVGRWRPRSSVAPTTAGLPIHFEFLDDVRVGREDGLAGPSPNVLPRQSVIDAISSSTSFDRCIVTRVKGTDTSGQGAQRHRQDGPAVS